MSTLQNWTVFVISTHFLQRGGANITLFSWKQCQIRKAVPDKVGKQARNQGGGGGRAKEKCVGHSNYWT